MVSFRDSSVVIIESGRTLIRAGIGLHDLLKAPSYVRIVPLSCLSSICDDLMTFRKFKLESVYDAVQVILQMAYPRKDHAKAKVYAHLHPAVARRPCLVILVRRRKFTTTSSGLY
jgi:hypothetical protein